MEKEKIKYLINYHSNLLTLEEKSKLKYPYLSDIEREVEEERLANLLLEKYTDKIKWNLCPKCEKLCRTPFAKQCRFCKNDWH